MDSAGFRFAAYGLQVHTHASSPRVYSGSRARRSSLPLSSGFPCKGRAERLGGSPRPRRHVLGTHGTRCLLRGMWLRAPLEGHTVVAACYGSRPRKQETTCVPHATVLSACNSQRRHVLGALTECLVPPHCWVLGPPTAGCGMSSFHYLAASLAFKSPALRTKGPQSRRGRRIPLHAGDMTGAPLGRNGMELRYTEI